MTSDPDTAQVDDGDTGQGAPSGGAARSLYIHVPFCLKRCDYCDFDSSVYDHAVAGRYVDAVVKELDARAAGCRFETVYIGGGTPTALDNDILERLLAAVAPRLDGESPVEYTIEANPSTIDAAMALLLKARGVNRASLGVQSFNDLGLAVLGRTHTADDARAAFGLLRERELGDVAIDLMTALPMAKDGGKSTAATDVDEAIALAPEHISVYILSVEPGTPLEKRIAKGELVAAEADRAADEYSLVREKLVSAGYEHYEISNFCLPGHRARHNSNYWTGGDYIGVGASAASYTGGARRTNVRGAGNYALRSEAGANLVASMERLSPERSAREALVLSLRMPAGVNAAEFRSRTGYSPRELAAGAIDSAIEAGLLEEMSGVLRLKKRGIMVADSVMAELL